MELGAGGVPGDEPADQLRDGADAGRQRERFLGAAHALPQPGEVQDVYHGYLGVGMVCTEPSGLMTVLVPLSLGITMAPGPRGVLSCR